jgi:hypothetical protein
MHFKRVTLIFASFLRFEMANNFLKIKRLETVQTKKNVEI